jgi:hypothetical protein
MVSFQIMMNLEEFILINQKIGILVNQAILLMDKLIFIQYYYTRLGIHCVLNILQIISNVIRLSVQMCSPSNVDIFNLDIGNGNKNQKTPKDFKVLK